MDNVDLDALDRLHAASTQGEWYAMECWPGQFSLNTNLGGERHRIFDCNEFDRHGEAKDHDAKLCAELHNAYPALAAAANKLDLWAQQSDQAEFSFTAQEERELAAYLRSALAATEDTP